MDPFDDITAYELCFPGSVTGGTEIVCPHCDKVITVPVVDDPMATLKVRCCECEGMIEVNLAELTVAPIFTAKIRIEIEDDD